MNAVGRIAWHVYTDGVRDRVLFALAVCAAALVLAAVAVAGTSAGQDTKVLRDIGLAVIELSGVLMVMTLGASLVSRDVERRTLYLVLVRPIPRWQIITGKACGLSMTVLVHVAALGTLLMAADVLLGGAHPQAVITALVLVAGELVVLLTVALLLSTISSSAFLAAAMTLGVWVVGLLSADLQQFVAPALGPVESVVRALGHVVPQFAAFDGKTAAVYTELGLSWRYVGLTLAYGAAYAGAMVAAAALVFSAKEFE
jgi:ABC-type transport system involved in multi-copper enzyme maturation permease subunit